MSDNISADAMTPENALRGTVGVSDDELEAEVRGEREADKQERLERAISEAYGSVDEFLEIAEPQDDQMSSEDIQDQARAELEQLRQDALAVGAKLVLPGSEYEHVSLNDPYLLPIAQRIFARNPKISAAGLARETFEAVTQYRGQGPRARQIRQQRVADGIKEHRAKIKQTISKESYLGAKQNARFKGGR